VQDRPGIGITLRIVHIALRIVHEP
jgi:hypothetical protein